MPVLSRTIQRAIDTITHTESKNALKAAVSSQNVAQQRSAASGIKVPAGLNADNKNAALFAHHFLGFKRTASAPAMRGVTAGWGAPRCEKEVEAVYKSWRLRNDLMTNTKTSARVALGSSFFLTKTGRDEVAKEAIKYSQLMITSAFLAIKRAKSSTNVQSLQRRNYVWFFGLYDAARMTTVHDNIQTIYNALARKPVSAYYRGPGVDGIDDSPDMAGQASSNDDVASTWSRSDLEGEELVYSSAGGVTRVNALTHIWLGEGTFERTYSISKGHDTIAGAILHELSHFLCDTNGTAPYENEVYRPGPCHNLANTNPAHACHNADSYQCYFEKCLNEGNKVWS